MRTQKATPKTEKVSEVRNGGGPAKTLRARFPSKEINANDRHCVKKLTWSQPLRIISVTIVEMSFTSLGT